MSQFKKTVSEIARETTAIISILTENHQDLKLRFSQKKIMYSIHLSFVGATILPPFLPCIKDTAMKRDRDSILNTLEEISDKYIDSYSDMKLTLEEGQEIKNTVVAMGKEIAHYLPHFTQILENVTKMNVSNIIIHTDDFAIPWTWAYYYLSLDLMQYLPDPPDTEDEPMDFLCNRYPCGTLIVDTQEDSFHRLKKFRDNVLGRATDKGLLKESEKVSLFQGKLPKSRICTEQLKGEYMDYLKGILRKRFKKNNIHLIDSDDWCFFSGKTDQFAHYLAGNIIDSKIVHYLGHVESGALEFDENTSVHPQDIASSLTAFSKYPLVVLHGCSSGKIVDLENKDRQLPTVFLEKGASGCVVALLPVGIPICQESGVKTMIDIFYRKVVSEMKPYGQALYEARHEFQNQKKTKHDPQWLFFHLYGDPRAMLITTSQKGILKMLEYIEEQEKKEHKSPGKQLTNEVRIKLRYSEDLLDADELLKELKDSDCSDVKMEADSILLDGLAGLAVAVFVFVGEKLAEEYILKIKEKILDQLKKRRERSKKKKQTEVKAKKTGKKIEIEDISKPSRVLKLLEDIDDL
jgi:hypothetical protein